MNSLTDPKFTSKINLGYVVESDDDDYDEELPEFCNNS